MSRPLNLSPEKISVFPTMRGEGDLFMVGLARSSLFSVFKFEKIRVVREDDGRLPKCPQKVSILDVAVITAQCPSFFVRAPQNLDLHFLPSYSSCGVSLSSTFPRASYPCLLSISEQESC